MEVIHRDVLRAATVVVMLALTLACTRAVPGAAEAARAGNSGTPSAAATTSPADRMITVPDLTGMTGGQAGSALAAAGALDVRYRPSDAVMTNPVTGQQPAAGTRQRAGDPVTVTLAVPPPPPHRAIAARDWQIIAKDPDAHRGERIIVHGHVTQFDSATGTDVFRASVDGVAHKRPYEYETNTMLRGTADQLKDLVLDDLFRAEVTVSGSLTYDTQIGGSTTVPVLTVDSITRTS